MSSDDTLEQLRADIDSGRTGDKVSAPDPAMAPLVLTMRLPERRPRPRQLL